MSLTLGSTIQAYLNQPFPGLAFHAGGGARPYSYSVAAGVLPAGMSLNTATGLVSGAPTALGTAAGLVVRATDSASAYQDSPPFTLRVRQAADYVATTAAELVTHVNSAVAAGGGKIIEVADGDATAYGSTIIDLKNKNPSARITIVGASYRGAKLPGVDLQGSSKITLQDLELFRLRSVTGVAADPLAGVVRVHSTQDIWIDNCEIHADPMQSADLNGYMQVSSVTGTFADGDAVTTGAGGSGVFRIRPRSSATVFAISDASGLGNGKGGKFADQWLGKQLIGPNGTAIIGDIVSNVQFLVGVAAGSRTTPAHRLKVTNCDIHDVKWGVAACGTDIEMSRNRIADFYASPFDFNGDCSGLTIRLNECINGWAKDTDGQPSGTNGPHSSVGGFSFSYFLPQNILLEGNKLMVGRARADAGKGQAYATGPKINDMECEATASISGTTLTITTDPTLYYVISPGFRVLGPGVAPGTVIEEVLTGSGKIGTYRVNISQTVASAKLYLQSRAKNVKIFNNLIDCNGSIGFQFGFVKDSEFAYNTIVQSTDVVNADATPSLYVNDIDGGCVAHHNVVTALSQGAQSRVLDATFLRDSSENIVAQAVASGPASYSGLFQGIGGATPFAGATLGDVLTMYAPKAGGRLAGGVGATAYFDFATGVSSRPSYTPPQTAVATGVSLSRVKFDGGYTRYSVVSPETMLGMTNPDVFTVIIGVKVLADGVDSYLLTSTPSPANFQVRRLASNKLRIVLQSSSGVAVSIDTAVTLTVADGPVVLAMSFDLPNYRFAIMKGPVSDGMANVTAWSGASLTLNATTMTLMSTSLAAEIGFFYATDQYVDLLSSAGMSQVVALDGKPVDYGASGQNVTGTTPRVYLKGDATAWNAGGGLNLGSAPRKFVGGGNAVTDV